MIVNKIGLSEILRADPWLDPDSVHMPCGELSVAGSRVLWWSRGAQLYASVWKIWLVPSDKVERERGRESERAAVCLVQSVSELWGRAVTDTRGELRYDVSVTASYRIIALFDFFHKSSRSFPFPLFFFWWLQTFRSNEIPFLFLYFHLFLSF